MALTYIAGAVIYGARFPERVKPGMFNYFVRKSRLFFIYIYSYTAYFRVHLIKYFTSVS